MKRADKIDKLINELENELTSLDSLLIVFVDGTENIASTGLTSMNVGMLITAICESFDDTDKKRAQNMSDLFVSVIVTYAKAHPEFATKFIQTFNKIMYGTDIYD